MSDVRLRRIEGAAAGRQLSASLEHLATALPYLRASVGAASPWVRSGEAPDDHGWMACDELIADPFWLERVVASTGKTIGASSRAVAGSLFVLGYAYRVLTLALSLLITSGVAPDSRAGAMAIGLRSGRPSRVDYSVPAALVATCDGALDPPARLDERLVTDRCLGFVIDTAIEGHLRDLIDSLRSRTRLGRRLLWGNVAAGAATAFRTMDPLHGVWVRGLATRFFELAPSELHGQGAFFALEGGGARGWYWERANCCLNDRLPDKIRCSDCPKTPSDLRRSAYLARLRSVES